MIEFMGAKAGEAPVCGGTGDGVELDGGDLSAALEDVMDSLGIGANFFGVDGFAVEADK